jgi:hypothetical protein
MADDNETTSRDNLPADKPKYNQTFFLALATKGRDAWNDMAAGRPASVLVAPERA